MAAGAAVHESIGVAGQSSATVLAALEAAVAGDAAYKHARTGDNAFHLARTYRPGWAVAAGLVLLPLFGLGILFFFVRRSESCLITVVDGPRGAVITVSGTLLRDQLDRIVAEVQSPSLRGQDGATTRSSDEVSLQPSTASDETVARSLVSTTQSAPTAIRPHPLALKFDDGEIVALESIVLIGRDPTASTFAGAGVRAVSVDDRAVSKSHLRVAFDEHGAWVEDLNSTNGTSVERPDGAQESVAPGMPTRIAPGSIVKFGDRRVELVCGG